MGIVFNGRIVGKVGDCVYYLSKSGKQLVRKAPKQSTKVPTAGQLAQRERFKTVVSFLFPFKPLLKLFPDIGKKRMSAYNAALKQVIEQAVTGNYPGYEIDYPKVTLYRGSLFPLPKLAISRNSEEIIFSWYFIWDKFYHTNVAMVAYSPYSHNVIYQVVEHYPVEGTCSLTVPQDLRDEPLETWILFIDQGNKKVSSSIYCGSVEVESQLPIALSYK